jgi:hypothetical protein
MSEQTAALSVAGLARRDQILSLVQRAGRRRRVRRRLMSGGAALVVLLSAGGVLRSVQRAEAPEFHLAIADGAAPATAPNAPASTAEAPVRPPAVSYAIVSTPPDILRRYAAPADAGRSAIYIGDSELSRELGAAGHDPGVIRTPTDVIVVASSGIAAGGG